LETSKINKVRYEKVRNNSYIKTNVPILKKTLLYLKTRLYKPFMAFWLVSHCTTVINREGYVDKLKGYINITQYGRCNGEDESEVCGRKKFYECFKELAKTHMFYIAFENSICDDYATEKFFRPLYNSG
jgi:hypothetical protein